MGTTAAGSVVAGRSFRQSSSDAVATTKRVTSDGFESKADDGRWEDRLVRGVNLGMAKPAHFPGDAAITRAEYDRWLAQISAMNANVVRTYTLHPPAFYDALAEHNADRERPLLLLQGNWIAETVMAEADDMFDPAVISANDTGIENAIDAVHGTLSPSDHGGVADGRYRSDVSPYVLGYVLGTEWEPAVVERTDERHADIGEYDGRYLTTNAATPFEHWLAARLDDAATYERDRYDTLRPLSVTNWPPTDHIDQPTDPEAFQNDADVTLDHLLPTDEFTPGLFATYHVYPYFPPFMNHEPDYLEYTAENGVESSFRGYLADLVAESDYPVLVGEFGVPSSRGLSQRQVQGFHQGHHTEREQGERNAELYEHIVNSGALGGVVFTWQDEWFKRVWNTAEYTEPDRRPFWMDRQTSEQAYGLLSFDPRGETDITLSGDLSEWEHASELYTTAESDFGPESEPLVALEDGHDGARTLTGLSAAADPGSLSLKLSYDDLGSVVDWERTNTLVFLDITPERGITSMPFETGLHTSEGVDFLVNLAGPDDSRVLVDSYSDRFYYHYGELLGEISAIEYAGDRDRSEFHAIELALGREMEIPSLDETIEFESYETGRLRFGVGDPDHEAYDSLADVCVTPEENTIEIRLPWLLLNVRDPSQRIVAGDFWTDGLSAETRLDSIGVSAATFLPNSRGEATDLESPTNITDSLSPITGDELVFGSDSRFAWETWNEPAYDERLKQSYDVMQETFGDL